MASGKRVACVIVHNARWVSEHVAGRAPQACPQEKKQSFHLFTGPCAHRQVASNQGLCTTIHCFYTTCPQTYPLWITWSEGYNPGPNIRRGGVAHAQPGSAHGAPALGEVARRSPVYPYTKLYTCGLRSGRPAISYFPSAGGEGHHARSRTGSAGVSRIGRRDRKTKQCKISGRRQPRNSSAN